MGKNYERELKELDTTYSWAMKTSIKEILHFVDLCQGHPMLAIGSGGSFTAASFASSLHQETGMLSKCMTPLEFVSMRTPIHDVCILLLTARGRNSDILRSFEDAISREPKQIMAICTTKRSSLIRAASRVGYMHYSDFDLPSGRDGFLATNSLMAMTVLLARAYAEYIPWSCAFPISLGLLVHPNASRQEFMNQFTTTVQPLLGLDTLVILYDNWGRTAAIDAECKFTESGLANVLLTDYRNFGHGRHNWLSKHKDKIGVVGLVSDDGKSIAAKTLDLIPSDIPVVRVSTDYSGPVASAALLVMMMYLLGSVAESKDVDPGRPRISQFGRRIYNIRIPTLRKGGALREMAPEWEAVAILRKAANKSSVSMSNGELQLWRNAYQTFVSRLEMETFCGVVFDYDGTLCDTRSRYTGASKEIGKELERLLGKGITVGVATGRGGSVREDLQKVVRRDYWSRLVIGYYNGSEIGMLGDVSHPDHSIETDPTIRLAKNLLENNELVRDVVEFDFRPRQITFNPKGTVPSKEIMRVLQSVILKTSISGIQILESSHSIDLLAPGVSKLTIVRAVETAARELGRPSSVLCIGDKGEWPGNDFYLLSEKYSLSVDTVSPDLDSCWNLAPVGHRGVQATFDYFNAMNTDGGALHFNIKNIGAAKNER